MGQVLHGSATTTEAIRRAIQRSQESLRALAKRYAGSKYVSVMPLQNEATKSGRLEPEALNETNMLELYVFASDKYHQAVLVARLDKLGKGASGAAVQNMRLMLGLPEE